MAEAGGRIVVAGEAGQTEPTALLAVDDDDLILGATRRARRAYGWPRCGWGFGGSIWGTMKTRGPGPDPWRLRDGADGGARRRVPEPLV